MCRPRARIRTTGDGSGWLFVVYRAIAEQAGRLDPASGAFKEYVLKIEDSGPHGLVADANGNIWFTGNGKGYIGKLDPKSGAVTAYQMPDEKAEDPHTAVFDARGILWFTVQVGSMVGRLDPRTGKIDLKAVQGQRPLPYGIAINSKGVPFFCEFGTNKMAKIDPQTMAITEFYLRVEGAAAAAAAPFARSLNSVIAMVCGSILAILLVPNSQKNGTPLLLMAMP